MWEKAMSLIPFIPSIRARYTVLPTKMKSIIWLINNTLILFIVMDSIVFDTLKELPIIDKILKFLSATNLLTKICILVFLLINFISLFIVSGKYAPIKNVIVSEKENENMFSRKCRINMLNDSKEAIIIKGFLFCWNYMIGPAMSIEEGEPIQPKAKYSICFDLDVQDESKHKDFYPISNLFTIPAKSILGSSIGCFDVELIYRMVGKYTYHPSSWNIKYDLFAVDAKDRRIKILDDYCWVNNKIYQARK